MSKNKIKKRIQQAKNITRNLRNKILEFLDNRALPTSLFIDEEDYNKVYDKRLEKLLEEKSTGGIIKRKHGSQIKRSKKKPRGWGAARYSK